MSWTSGNLLIIAKKKHNCNARSKIEKKCEFQMYVWVVCMIITSKAKINAFWNFLIPVGRSIRKKIQKTFILAFEANSALVALIYFCTLRKWSAILGLSFSAWCWFPRESLLRGQASLGNQRHAE